jgi:hypothetical protein
MSGMSMRNGVYATRRRSSRRGVDSQPTAHDKPPVTFVVILRLAKFVGVLAFAMGLALALAPSTTPDMAAMRRRAAYWLATPGFILTWIAGWGMAKQYAISLGRPWVSISMLASLVALHELLRDVEPGRPRSRVRVAVIVLALFVSLTSMVVRDG